MKNQSKHYTEFVMEINTVKNFQDLMQVYLDAHYQNQHGSLDTDDFNFLRIIFSARFNELGYEEKIKKGA